MQSEVNSMRKKCNIKNNELPFNAPPWAIHVTDVRNRGKLIHADRQFRNIHGMSENKPP